MVEAEYWAELEYRVCRELQGFEGKARFLWCDGFIPDEVELQAVRPCIRGRAWIGDDSGGQEEWGFALMVGKARSESEIDWSDLLPADDVTGWLHPDLKAKTLTMDPLSAFPQ